jgi:16S rRNA processing protein RimM
MNWDEMALVGRIARSHGNRGQVIVNPETDFLEERFHPGGELFVRRHGAVAPLIVTAARFQQGRPILGFEGVNSIDAADELAGLELRIPPDRLTTLPAGTFYRHDLIGCRVETTSGAIIGTVRDVEGTMHTSRLVVDGRGEVLIPLADEICRTIDVAAKRIVVDPPEGLVELNERAKG